MRQRIVESTARIIGERGYAEASVARIVDDVGISQGTFYRYFETRQDLFDIVLPTYAERMLTFIQEHVDAESTGIEREMQRMKAFLDFVADHPWFARIVDEANVQAPAGNDAYFDRVVNGYVRTLQRAVDRGEIVGYDPEDLEGIALALLAARSYYAKVYLSSMGHVGKSRDAVLKGYRAFVERALFMPPCR
ncbi:TetR/AcrR family transcriptional regulator [Nocardioides sp. QY071]|uniref:TetR/AcrR family transcriptional regulator n=1 Tax=Nocardioides sp. QY071 TaxID=3044187 RepID=UPI00249CCBAE|nr:TetR/AcrR family transcriptional regulator [Nocardioides sp. QY071]WGY00450.1 TetR/AcrR family transcriptional regulator [Nocardioides sp. QY071]